MLSIGVTDGEGLHRRKIKANDQQNQPNKCNNAYMSGGSDEAFLYAVQKERRNPAWASAASRDYHVSRNGQGVAPLKR